MPLADFEASAPGLPFSTWLAGLGMSEDSVGELVVTQPSFFTDVAGLLTDERLPAWRSWAAWSLVSSRSPYLSSAFVQERFGFYGTVLSGTPVLKERWKRGVDLVEGALGEAVGKIYVERHFSPVAKERMDTLVANLIEAYRRSISDLAWMTDETKARALDKLGKFRSKIGFPTRWRDYSTLEIVPGDLLGNVARATEFELQRSIAKIGAPIDREEWLMTPQTVNAYYHPLRNEIVFPAAILQPPFFNEDADDAVNYGGIGAVIGHEIGHGFDDQGSTCDGDGRLENWWTDADREAFEERTKVSSRSTTPSPPRRPPTCTSTARSPSGRTSVTSAGCPSRSSRTASPGRRGAGGDRRPHRRAAAVPVLGGRVAEQGPRRARTPAPRHRPPLAGRVPLQPDRAQPRRLLRGVRRAGERPPWLDEDQRVSIW